MNIVIFDLRGEYMIKIKLSEILGRHRITQKQLAEIADLRPATISLIYHEKISRLDLHSLDKICKALNCQPGDLLEHIPSKE